MAETDPKRPNGEFCMKKRREKRFRQWNKARIRTAEAGRTTFDSEEGNAFTYDLSLGGARIHAEKGYPVGTVIQVQIELSRTGQSVLIEGEVKWIKENEAEGHWEMGVEFLHRLPRTLMSLMKNLYDENSRIPLTLDPSAELPRTA